MRDDFDLALPVDGRVFPPFVNSLAADMQCLGELGPTLKVPDRFVGRHGGYV